MAKTVSLNEFTYGKLVGVSGKLTIMAKKPVSLGLTVDLALTVFETIMLEEPKRRELLEKSLKDLVSIGDFDKLYDAFYKLITEGKLEDRES